ncbi:MAG: hypothetical protein IPK32_06605 [Verrucomicrobiaceae bacterium]|nr:hypothetical protein [Verrucomicrobiaceae bacterium]
MPTFTETARRVCMRVTLRRWLSCLERTLWPVSGLLALLLLFAWRGGAGIITALWLAWLLWTAGSLLITWLRRPGEFSALALWDAAAGRREAFATAWWFESHQEPSHAAQVHLAAQKAALPAALPALARDLPLRPARWLALPLLLVFLGTLISAVRTPRAETLLVDDEMAAQAARAARELQQHPLDAQKLSALDAQEKKQIEELKTRVAETAAELTDASGKDARELLAKLERQAREAEKTANQLTEEKDAWASDPLVSELRNHADTADLGDAIAAKKTANAVQAAEKLSQTLQDTALPPEASQRMTQTLTDVKQAAEEADRSRVVGGHVLRAADHMQSADPKAAGAEFQKLAEKLREQQLREMARDELRQLAQQLREAGGAMTGEAGDVQQLGQQGQSAQPGQEGQPGASQQVGQSQPGQQGAGQQQQMLTPPGIGGQEGQNQMMQPQPGAEGGQGEQKNMMTLAERQPGQQPGEGQVNQGQPMLIAPVPGMPPPQPDDKSPIVVLPGGEDSGGPSISVNAPNAGGNKPGAGKAELNNTPTEKIDTTQQSVVQAQSGNEGQSTTRSVAGGQRSGEKAAAPTSAPTALDALQAEEAALDEAALPPARRAQVRRYFNELRRRFEGTK